jgi:hypothetical protein
MDYLIQTATKFAPQLLFLAFLLVTFLTSAIDKITDWNGNIAYFDEHFSNTFLKGKSSLMLGFLTLLEVISSIGALIGIVQIYLSGDLQIGFWAAIISAKTLLIMLLGQRIAKDYAGAMTIAVYFGITLYGITLLLV